jgi:hypothetical protein
MISILTAATIATSLYFSMQGAMAATYIIIALLGMNIMLVTFSSATLVGMRKHMLKNPENYLKKTLENREDPLIHVLIRLMLLVGVYQVFLLGYVFFAGAATVSLTISIIAGVWEWFDNNFLDKKDEE